MSESYEADVTGLGTNLPGVEEIERIDRLLDRPHEFDGALSQFFVQVTSLPETNAVLSCTCRAVRACNSARVCNRYSHVPSRSMARFTIRCAASLATAYSSPFRYSSSAWKFP